MLLNGLLFVSSFSVFFFIFLEKKYFELFSLPPVAFFLSLHSRTHPFQRCKSKIDAVSKCCICTVYKKLNFTEVRVKTHLQNLLQSNLSFQSSENSKFANRRVVGLFLPAFINRGQLALPYLGKIFWLWSCCSVFDHINSFPWILLGSVCLMTDQEVLLRGRMNFGVLLVIYLVLL